MIIYWSNPYVDFQYRAYTCLPLGVVDLLHVEVVAVIDGGEKDPLHGQSSVSLPEFQLHHHHREM